VAAVALAEEKLITMVVAAVAPVDTGLEQQATIMVTPMVEVGVEQMESEVMVVKLVEVQEQVAEVEAGTMEEALVPQLLIKEKMEADTGRLVAMEARALRPILEMLPGKAVYRRSKMVD
jgi:hypothetical protein